MTTELTTEYYVLWTNRGGYRCWSGPHDSFDKAAATTPMLDRLAEAFVVMRYRA